MHERSGNRGESMQRKPEIRRNWEIVRFFELRVAERFFHCGVDRQVLIEPSYGKDFVHSRTNCRHRDLPALVARSQSRLDQDAKTR